MAIQEQEKILVNFKKQAQVGVLLFNKAPTEISAEYSDYNNVFLAKNIAELPENTKIDKYVIKLKEDKQSLFGPIYSLGLVELKTLKTYIKTNLTNGFIRLSKSLTKAPIFFNRKLDKSFYLCVDYQSLNNITIKNRYPLSLIGKLLDQLGQTRRFI